MGKFCNTPLWPAGHLPLKGGDHSLDPSLPIAIAAGYAPSVTRIISPLEGEMAGRPEGGGYCRGLHA